MSGWKSADSSASCSAPNAATAISASGRWRRRRRRRASRRGRGYSGGFPRGRAAARRPRAVPPCGADARPPPAQATCGAASTPDDGRNIHDRILDVSVVVLHTVRVAVVREDLAIKPFAAGARPVMPQAPQATHVGGSDSEGFDGVVASVNGHRSYSGGRGTRSEERGPEERAAMVSPRRRRFVPQVRGVERCAPRGAG